MSLGESIIKLIHDRRERKLLNTDGPLGEFWRSGGKGLLYTLPVATGGIIIDAGGYEGEWTAEMISRYGCQSIIFEPIPEFVNKLRERFRENKLVQIHEAALGGRERTAEFVLNNDGSSEFLSIGRESIKVKVTDVSYFVNSQVTSDIDCLKLNIEGGEYEVLERLIETQLIHRFKSILVQFHTNPENYKDSLELIRTGLKDSHVQKWCFEMVWELWVKKS